MNLFDRIFGVPHREPNAWLEAGQSYGWKKTSLILDCLADMTLRIQVLEEKVKQLESSD